MDRAGAVDRDGDLSHSLGSDSRQIYSCPDVAPVGPHPAIVRRSRIRPGPAQKLTPVHPGGLRRFERPLRTGRQLTRELGNILRLFDANLPIPRLFGYGLTFSIFRLWRIEYLPDASRR